MDILTVDKLEGAEFTDRYTEAVAQSIEVQREEKPLPQVPEPEEPAKVLDLMAVLQESVQEGKASPERGAGVRQKCTSCRRRRRRLPRRSSRPRRPR
ncbi:hypothetical protein [Streptomyces sp. NPDC018347]|uniref:hypothetical protein n=1 Tax=Streptomyces sp. NPDC018347 TaxID=3157193 RepID=UPI0033FB0B1E